MPFITIITNVQGEGAAKKKLSAALTQGFSEEIKCPATHVHVHILDSQCFSFGGDGESPAAQITIKASALQILPDVRKVLVERMAPALQQAFNVPASRTTTFFEELPVENIAVGTSIAVFMKSPRTSLSPQDNKTASQS